MRFVFLLKRQVASKEMRPLLNIEQQRLLALLLTLLLPRALFFGMAQLPGGCEATFSFADRALHLQVSHRLP